MNAQDLTVGGLGERPGDDRFAKGLILLEAAPHGSAVYHARHALNHFFRRVQQRADVFIAHNLLLIHQDGEAEIRLGPDLLVAFGLSEEPVSSYRIADQGKPPDWVLEVTSPSTKTRDRTVKKDQYAAIGVREFWLLELAGRQRAAQLQGFRLERGHYVSLAPLEEDGPPTIRSEVLGLDLRLDGELLRVRDSQTGTAALAGRAEEAMTLDAATERQTDLQCGRKTDTRRHQAEANRQTESTARRATETHLLEAEAAQRNEADVQRDAVAARQDEVKVFREAEFSLQQEAEVRSDTEAAQRREAKAVREAEAAQRNEAKAVREAEAAQRNAAKAVREAEAAQRNEAKAVREAEAAQRNAAKAIRDAEARVAELEARIQILESSHPWNQANRKP